MIRNEAEYRAALRRMVEDQAFAAQQRTALIAANLSPTEIERAMQPTYSFHAQLAEEVTWYEQVKRGEIAPVHRLTEIGRLLIALRVANGWTQRQLAEQLRVDESQISRDERNEYYGLTLERAQRILDALQARTITEVEQPMRQGEPASVS